MEECEHVPVLTMIFIGGGGLILICLDQSVIITDLTNFYMKFIFFYRVHSPLHEMCIQNGPKTHELGNYRS